MGSNVKEIAFNWDIHLDCNYRCPYCWFFGRWDELKDQNLYLEVPRLVEFWKNIYSRYGQVKLAITGGEPFLYPGFIDLIKEISRLHKIEIVTNFSTDITDFINNTNLENIEIRPSFHPLFADFNVFVEMARALKRKKPRQEVSYLAWPGQIKKFAFYQKEFLKSGISIFTQPFYGEYEGLRYPDAYTQEEKEAIMPFLGNRGGEPFQVKSVATKGKLCAAGQRYAVIQADGKIVRCGGLNSSNPDKAVIGEISDKNFNLLDQPQICSAEVCPCNEWAFLLADDTWRKR